MICMVERVGISFDAPFGLVGRVWSGATWSHPARENPVVRLRFVLLCHGGGFLMVRPGRIVAHRLIALLSVVRSCIVGEKVSVFHYCFDLAGAVGFAHYFYCCCCLYFEIGFVED